MLFNFRSRGIVEGHLLVSETGHCRNGAEGNLTNSNAWRESTLAGHRPPGPGEGKALSDTV